ncbi:MAG TPA: AAA family ATPase [Mycobacteriales bacterium]
MAGPPPFVGRQRELARLHDRLSAAGAGAGGVLLVSGPAGIGKTRLVEEALRGHAGPVGRGRCTDDPGAPPFWPWSRAFRALHPGLAAALPGAGAGSGDPGAVAAERFRALTVVTDALLRAAAAAPVVIVLEDLHWADAESLDLLRRVAAEAADAPLLVLVTHRDLPPDEVAAAVADVRRDAGTEALPLPPLTEQEVGDYLGRPGAEAHRRTGGLPLLLAAGGDLPVVVAGMLARLSEPHRAAIGTLALLGDDTGPAVLAEVTGTDPGPALAAARRAGLLAAPTEDGLPFAHALVRDAVRAQVPAPVALGLHRRAAAALTGTDPGRAAAHWRAAGDPRAAAGCSARAAEQAEQALALDPAARLRADAVTGLREAGAADAELAAALVRLATAEFRAGRLPASLAGCEEAAAAATRAGRPDLLAEAALVIRGVTYPEVAQVLGRLSATALAADLPTATRARLLAQAATMAAERGDPGQAEELAVEALRTAERDGDPPAVLDAARAREMTLLGAADGPERLRLGRLAVDRADELGQPLAGATAAGWLLRAGYELARLDVVSEAVGRLERVAGRSGLPLARWHLLRAQAARATTEGAFAAAREFDREATDVARATGDPTAAGLSYAYAAHLTQLRGDPGDLPPDFWDVLRHFPAMPLIRAHEANLLLVSGRRDEAAAIWDELSGGLAGMVADFRWNGALLEFAGLAAAFEDRTTAGVLYDRLSGYRDCPGTVGVATVYFSGSPLRELGLLAATAGRAEEGIALLRRAIAANLAVRGRPLAAVTRLDLAHLLDPGPEAEVLARAAADEFRRLDMPGPLARADRLLAALASARRHADPLTARERQVADLVVQARSNRDIAEELVLSERTVESHVRNILAKLQLANRTELIARGR